MPLRTPSPPSSISSKTLSLLRRVGIPYELPSAKENLFTPDLGLNLIFQSTVHDFLLLGFDQFANNSVELESQNIVLEKLTGLLSKHRPDKQVFIFMANLASIDPSSASLISANSASTDSVSSNSVSADSADSAHSVHVQFFDLEFLVYFFDPQKGLQKLPSIHNFINFTAENILPFYQEQILRRPSASVLALKELIRHTKKLHQDFRLYGQLSSQEMLLVVSAILLALNSQIVAPNSEPPQQKSSHFDFDGKTLFDVVRNYLTQLDLLPAKDLELVLQQFSLVRDRKVLSTFNPDLGQTPLSYFIKYIDTNLADAVRNNSSEDVLGRFYQEFVSSNQEQSSGIVLTPRHISELFCELVDLRPDDKVLDPCCGAGGFLNAARYHMLCQAPDDEVRQNIQRSQIYGVEIRPDMLAIAVANIVLRSNSPAEIKANLSCTDFLQQPSTFWQTQNITVGMMNPPYSQATKQSAAELSELNFVQHLLESLAPGARLAVILPESSMIGKTALDRKIKEKLLQSHTLEGTIALAKHTFYHVGVNTCIAIFTAKIPHPPQKLVKFINFENDGFVIDKHTGLVATELAKERRQYLLDCWFNAPEITELLENSQPKNHPKSGSKISSYVASPDFYIEHSITSQDEWLHSFFYHPNFMPSESDFLSTVADYLSFEFDMSVHGHSDLFHDKPKLDPN